MKYLEDFFIYQANFGAIAPGASLSFNINIQNDADFKVQKLTYFSEIAGGLQTDSSRVVPLLNMTILDTGSGRQLQDRAVPVASLCGTGKIPFILSQPKIFTARSTIEVTLENVSAGTTYATTEISFIGVKLFAVAAGR